MYVNGVMAGCIFPGGVMFAWGVVWLFFPMGFDLDIKIPRTFSAI